MSRPRMICTWPNCQDPSCDREHEYGIEQFEKYGMHEVECCDHGTPFTEDCDQCIAEEEEREAEHVNDDL